jgi:sec-independent protein translocase protein TatA
MPIHPLWLVVILVLVLIIFGPGRLPELGGAIGKAMREFRKATTDLTSEVTSASQATPPPATAGGSAPAQATSSESTAKGSSSEADLPKS